jgi:hypothetical protein
VFWNVTDAVNDPPAVIDAGTPDIDTNVAWIWLVRFSEQLDPPPLPGPPPPEAVTVTVVLPGFVPPRPPQLTPYVYVPGEPNGPTVIDCGPYWPLELVAMLPLQAPVFEQPYSA